MFAYHAIVLTGTALGPVTIPRDKAVRTVACCTLCMGYFAARGLMYFNLTCSSESLLAFREEIVLPLLDIHAIGYKAVFPMLTVGLFVVVFDVVEINLTDSE